MAIDSNCSNHSWKVCPSTVSSPVNPPIVGSWKYDPIGGITHGSRGSTSAADVKWALLKGIVESDPTACDPDEITVDACTGVVATAADATDTGGVEPMATTEGGWVGLVGDDTSVCSSPLGTEGIEAKVGVNVVSPGVAEATAVNVEVEANTDVIEVRAIDPTVEASTGATGLVWGIKAGERGDSTVTPGVDTVPSPTELPSTVGSVTRSLEWGDMAAPPGNPGWTLRSGDCSRASSTFSLSFSDCKVRLDCSNHTALWSLSSSFSLQASNSALIPLPCPSVPLTLYSFNWSSTLSSCFTSLSSRASHLILSSSAVRYRSNSRSRFTDSSSRSRASHASINCFVSAHRRLSSSLAAVRASARQAFRRSASLLAWSSSRLTPSSSLALPSARVSFSVASAKSSSTRRSDSSALALHSSNCFSYVWTRWVNPAASLLACCNSASRSTRSLACGSPALSWRFSASRRWISHCRLSIFVRRASIVAPSKITGTPDHTSLSRSRSGPHM